MAFAPSKRRLARGRTPNLLVLNITSMLDMFTILILFLLKSYSADGMIITIPADLSLPYSTTQTNPRPGLVVELSQNHIVVDGEIIPVDLALIEASEEILIPELFSHLTKKARQFKEIAAINPAASFKGQMVLEGDREVPFRLLKKILYTCGQAGFINQSLAVFQK